RYKDFKGWSWLFFWALVTHPMLDAFTTWGTQLFWPLDVRLAFKSIFVIDPLYTLPFLVFLILTLFQKRTSKKRRIYNFAGLTISTSYLVVTLIAKGIAYTEFESALKLQAIDYKQIDIRPSPFNTILWNANIETEDSYLLGSYSFFDTQDVSFDTYPKNHDLLGALKANEKVKRMIAISEGWYTIQKVNDNLYYNDLRFGLLNLKPQSQDFVFKYLIEVASDGTVRFIEQEKTPRDGRKLMSDLWQRVKGN
ncbi:MAG TPA: metal-dependent hydrolase, partial [Aquaticitalea sp.]|nr:metal-dependent hydrolase [Aquaticitalea sp.]